eukprot:TRINITY_DN24112_c0_g2_i2.p1 TRINITY_DN24112_c0_g2~~TRINITY_DN24112_c0_g2_i2.p1  ORF type:complete len:594 (+),score=159.31 TRINITY_DN24112_c0_g2_i2:178-1959(+)
MLRRACTFLILAVAAAVVVSASSSIGEVGATEAAWGLLRREAEAAAEPRGEGASRHGGRARTLFARRQRRSSAGNAGATLSAGASAPGLTLAASEMELGARGQGDQTPEPAPAPAADAPAPAPDADAAAAGTAPAPAADGASQNASSEAMEALKKLNDKTDALLNHTKAKEKPKPKKKVEAFDMYKKEIPEWAQARKTFSANLMLPHQPKCEVFAGLDDGVSDLGETEHVCTACEDGCTKLNKQMPMQVKWSIDPPLWRLNAMDVMVMVEFPKVTGVAPYTLNGIQHKINFDIGRKPRGGRASPWRGYMATRLRGGAAPGEALPGQHIFTILDTEPPNLDGSVVKGRWLALPGRRVGGDVGVCKRACIECEDDPKLLAAGYANGAVCVLDVTVQNNQGFLYRLRQSSDGRSAAYAGGDYRGSEFELQVRDANNGNFYNVGRIVLEGNGPDHGVAFLDSRLEHLGCAPCDAYYQAVKVTGPFVLSPAGEHQIVSASSVDLRENGEGEDCGLKRVASLGGLTVMYESGPGVWPTEMGAKEKGLYTCPLEEKDPLEKVLAERAKNESITEPDSSEEVPSDAFGDAGAGGDADAAKM